MFIEPNEHIIIMDQAYNLLMPDELAMLRDVGIKTIHLSSGIRWRYIQPRPGVHYLKHLDARVDEYERAGLKALIAFFNSVPMWKPWEWYFGNSAQKGSGFFSYTNPDTASDIDDFAALLIERYKGRPVQFVYAMPSDGEFPVPVPRGERLPIEDDDLAAWTVARQKQLEAQHGEVWGALHHTCSPSYLEPIIKAQKDTFPNANHYSLQYRYWNHTINVFDGVNHIQEKYGVKYYVGSEYIQGMKIIAPYAVELGVRLIASPIHSLQEHRRVAPWMLDVIRDTLRQYEEANGA
jgi:hypothetical protein